MTTVNKHQAMINYLITCPTVSSNPLFFNFGEIKENNNQFLTTSNAESTKTTYIDGSESKIYVFTLLSFKTISYNAVVKTGSSTDENLSEITEFQEVIDWVNTQEKLHNYPNFGTDCNIDRISCLSANPVLADVDASVEPAIATYSITIQIEYLDSTNKLWGDSSTVSA